MRTRLYAGIFLGLILIPINAHWIALVSGVNHSLQPAYGSLFIAPVINLFFILSLNLILKNVAPQLVLNRLECIVIYEMLVMLCLTSGHNPMDFLLGTLIHPFWFASPENEYATLFHRHIPRWFTIENKEVLTGLFNGESSLYTSEHLTAWLWPVILWSGITFLIFFMLLCLNSIQRSQWITREKLSYPIAQLPIAMTKSGFFNQKLLWIGFLFVALIQILNGLNFLFPFVPRIPLKISNFGSTVFTTKPWNAIGWLPLFFYPWVIGLTFFVPLDLSFSVWFFFLLTKSQLVIGNLGGLKFLPGFPYYNHQGLGAWITLGGLTLWQSKEHIKGIIAKLFGNRTDNHGTQTDPSGHRWALLGMVFSSITLVLLFRQAGMSFSIILAFFAIYIVMSVAITHARAAVGIPYHEVIYTHPQLILVSVLGTRYIGAKNLTLMSFLYPYVRDNVSHPMPSQLEGFKIAAVTGMKHQKVMLVMTAGLFFSIFASFWSYLHVMYKYGINHASGYFIGIGQENFGRVLLSWLVYPQTTDHVGLSFTALASVCTIFLMIMRRSFLWWSFHPAGYALGMSSGTVWVWSAVFTGWIIKLAILKLGGLKMYRRTAPFFFGLVLGDYVIGFAWSIIGLIFNISVYRVWY